MNVKNRSCIRRLSYKALWASRKRNIIAVTAIFLTTLLFTSLFTVVLSINSSYQAYSFRQIGGYCHGTFKDVTKEQAQAIAAHPNVKSTGQRTVIGSISDGVFAKIPAEVSYMDENCTQWSYATPTVGHMPQKEDEIAMDTRALKLLGAEPKPGTRITITFTVGDKNQISHKKTETFTLSGFWEYDDISPVHYLNVSQTYAEAVEQEGIASGMEPFRTDLNVMMASGLNIRRQMEQVDLDLGYTWDSHEENSVRIGVNWGYTSAQLSERLDPQVLLAILAFLALIIFTGYLIIYNIFQISVTGDIRFYGLLKTIGVTPRQLRRIIRLQALFLCIIGIPAGLLLGYGVGAVLTPVVMANSTFGASVSTLSTSPLIFLGSALFALVTVLLSCSRPGRIAAKVSPVEATRYSEVSPTKKKNRTTRGAKIHQMAFANLGRNRMKTVLVVISLSLSVVLLDILVLFTDGFDMEKYLAQNTCADFIVSNTDYFRFTQKDSYLSREIIENIQENTARTTSGCGYTLSDSEPQVWMSEEAWLMNYSYFMGTEEAQKNLSQKLRRENLVCENVLIEGLDSSLFDKVTVIDGDLSPVFQENSHAIAIAVDTDDYGNPIHTDAYPALGETLSITYVQDAYYIDSRTGEKCSEDTPEEYLRYQIDRSHDVNYTVCAYVSVPYSMSYRYSIFGYSLVLPVKALEQDSGQKVVPLFYLFDTPDASAEADAEEFLADLTAGDFSEIMY